MATTAEVQLFFEQYLGSTANGFAELAQSGSERRNFTAESGPQKFIVTFNENQRENEAFFYFSEKLNELGLNVPEIYSISNDRKIYIQEFAGNNTLSEIIAEEGLSERVKNLVKKTLLHLSELQKKTANRIDYSRTFEYEQYDELPLTHDLYYFKNFVADVLEIHYHKSTLLKEFKKIVSRIENLQPQGLMIRDFQARNIMADEDDRLIFIDYQGAMKGPLMYDVVSFLFQAKADFPADFKEDMLEYYYSLWDPETRHQLKSSLSYIQLIRFMQVLGAYGFRGLVQKKKHFTESLHKGIDNLHSFLISFDDKTEFPELLNIAEELKSEKTQQKITQILN